MSENVEEKFTKEATSNDDDDDDDINSKTANSTTKSTKATSPSPATATKSTKIKINSLKHVRTWTQVEIVKYVEQLHCLLTKKDAKINKYKNKIRKLQHKIKQLKAKNANSDATTTTTTISATAKAAVSGAATTTTTTTSTTTASIKKNKELDKVTVEGEEEEDLKAAAAYSFVDEMRQVAEQARIENNFIYEPTSGLYYDQKSGYYYNAEYGLYYDGNTGCYYSYNKEKKTYEFHSQVQVLATSKPKKNKNNHDDVDVDDDDDIEFDEWGGVITDREILLKIKKKKRKLAKEKDKFKRKSKKAHKKHKLHATRKRKHKSTNGNEKDTNKAEHDDNDNDDNDNDDNDNDKVKNFSSKNVKRSSEKDYDFEDGELSSSSSANSSSSHSSHSSRRSSSSNGSKRDKRLKATETKNIAVVPTFKSCGQFQDIAKKYPPPLRIIVQETNLDELKVGNLNLITYKGGTLGREGTHDVIIPDLNVSKCHLRFIFDHKKFVYKCIDLGSRNGTILNGARMSAEKVKSEPYDLVHGSILVIGQTKLLCHVHEGNSTCGRCEPGLLIEKTTNSTAASIPTNTVILSHKEQLKKLQKKYGLENEKFVDSKQNIGNYNDRAATRRHKVGSSNENEKTVVASVDTEISSENKGFKMLSKLGWSKGTTLGKTTEGLLEPINVSSNKGTTGLGCEDISLTKSLSTANKKKIELWKKTQTRYENTDIFCNDDSSEDSN